MYAISTTTMVPLTNIQNINWFAMESMTTLLLTLTVLVVNKRMIHIISYYILYIVIYMPFRLYFWQINNDSFKVLRQTFI